MSRPLPLRNHLEAVLQRCTAHDRCALFLDYDGTLTPIIEEATEARLTPAMRQLLVTLTQHAHYRIAIVSGRALADLRTRVDGQAMYLAGNHGLEIEGPGTTYHHPQAQRLRPQLEALLPSLQRDLEEVPGAWVEDKGLSLSVHFRRVAAALVPEVQARLLRLATPAVDAGLLTLRTGKAVLELRPHVQWDKGKAVQWITDHMRSHMPSASLLPLYIGDDDTDEDAFRALGATGIGIVVGSDRLQSAARYYVESVQQTAHFLSALSQLHWPQTSPSGGRPAR